MNVLVLGVGGNVSQGILKALKRTKIDMHIIGACISEMSLGLYMCDEAYISPYASEPHFMSWLIDLCNEKSVDIVLTGVEENVRAISQNIDYFEQNTKAVFVSSTYEQLKIGQDKYLTCEWLKKNDCNYPQYCMLDNDLDVEKLVKKVGFPLIAKPCSGKSAKGIYVIKDELQLNEVKGTPNYVLQQCVGTAEQEYTVGCYVDKQGTVRNIIIMKRVLKNGTTVYAKVVDDDDIREEAEKICRAYKPRGPLNIQMRKDENGRPICFELNVRFSGTTAMRSNFGYCDVEAMIREYILNENIDGCFQIKKGESFRFDEEMYIFADATEEMKRDGKICSLSSMDIRYAGK